MAKKRIPESSENINNENINNENINNENINGEVEIHSKHSTLCSLSPVLSEKRIFDLIHESVHIPQKTVSYRPTDKLVFVILGIMSGSEVVYDINYNLRVDQALLRAFGYEQCADQSVIQQTLDAATTENVQQLESALQNIWDQSNLTTGLLENAVSNDKVVTIDIDLSGQPASRNAEHSTKGYFAGKKNTYGRQLARVLVPQTQEIVTESLYPGNTTSCSPFKAMITKMEQALHLNRSLSRGQRQSIRLRLDGGFCTDENINYALWRNYQLLAKMRSSSCVRKLVKSVCEWVDVPNSSDGVSRQAGWVTDPHRYGRKTRQVAIRRPDAKKKDGYRYSVLITTDMEADIHSIVADYDARSGVPESSFCQDNQGLSSRKRRKRSFVAQQMLMLLSQLTHNLIRWIQNWMIDAVEHEQTTPPNDTASPTSVVTTLKERGMKRFVRQVLSLSGKVIMEGKRVVGIILNPFYPLISRMKTAFEALLRPFKIYVSLDEI